MVTSSIPALPRFFFTFSQARSKFFRLNTLSISAWTVFFPCLGLDVREVRGSAVSSVLVLGLSRRELSNGPGPTRCVAAFPTCSTARGLPPPPGLVGQAAPLHTAAVRGVVLGPRS